MREGEGEFLFLMVRATVPGSVADEITVGAVPGPAVIEDMTLEVTGPGMVLRGFAWPGRVATRQGIAVDDVVGGEILFTSATDQAQVAVKTGLLSEVVGDRFIAVGRVVPWGPWWLVVRVENFDGVEHVLTARLRIRLLRGGVERMVVPGGWRSGRWDPRRLIWGRDSLVG